MQIATFGFRGEALPSIASVSRLEIRTRSAGAPMGLKLIVEDGIKTAIEPCASPFGARVEARDLFAATPARLKFLKSDRAEALAAGDAVKRLAMAAPEVRFSFSTDLTSSFDWPAAGAGDAGFTERLRQALGDDFALNSVALDARRDGARLFGRVGLPLWPAERLPAVPVRQWSRGARQEPAGALRAYLDFLPRTGMRSRLFVDAGAGSASTSTLRKPKCAFATRPLSAALIVGAVKAAPEPGAAAPRPPGTATIAMRPPHPYQKGRPSPRCWRASPTAAAARSAAGKLAGVAPSAPASAAWPSEHDLAAPLGAARRNCEATSSLDERRRCHRRPARGA
jgi:DNA mismatch repair protein MutL